jgi:LmbE family N-acetylglucosaminyl deacetylase
MGRKKTTFLVIYPHPDDVEWSIPGTILRLTREGSDVYYCQVTDGAAGTLDATLTPEKLKAIRRVEIARAQKVLGVKHNFHLDFPDGNTYDRQAVREKIVRIIRLVKADIVLCLDPKREAMTHIDHRSAAWAGVEAASNAGWPLAHYDQIQGEGLKPHMVQQVWLFQTDRPSHYVDVSATFTASARARYAHQSQIGFGTLTPRQAKLAMDKRVRAAREGARELGARVGVRLAEPFRVLSVGVGHSRGFSGKSPWLLEPKA